jgi:hypothetical protein
MMGFASLNPSYEPSEITTPADAETIDPAP